MTNLHETVVKNLFDGVYLVDPQRRILYWNKGAELLTGYTSDQMLGTQCETAGLHHVDECGNQLCFDGCPLAATATDQQNREIEVYLRHADGHRLPVRVRSAPVHNENGELIGVLEVFSDNTQKKQTDEELERLSSMAYLDELTSLPNRRMLNAELTSRHAAFERSDWPYGLIIIDIDFFKKVNDQHGHDVGDEVLKVVGATLQSATRTSELVGRWGGEEFVAIVSNPEPTSLRLVGERFRHMVATSKINAAVPIEVTISAGAALAHKGQTVEELLQRADALLYQAKEQGRNRVVTSEVAGS